ncbi:hypothetical protein CYMTET_32705 [Cymbomonas tetramitiformis]|uniref:Uncharacterized protein n=1 Tax=Cymbomonas tetramitiformis TaxID=36881 RepID=A0AAE0KRN5_9CHLO|nr:hypothetical protein CYMTET_32705 [Cymbomonas tetramitiformis]
MEPTVPLHKLTVKAVLEEAVGDRGSLMASGKDKEIIDTRIREQVQDVMANVAVEGVMKRTESLMGKRCEPFTVARWLRASKRHWLVPELGHFHKKLHLLEAIGKLSWSLGYDSLAIYLGKKKVMRESQKGVFEVHQEFLAMVFDGMWEAAILEWHTDYVKRFQNPSETSVDDKIADFLLYMDEDHQSHREQGEECGP